MGATSLLPKRSFNRRSRQNEAPHLPIFRIITVSFRFSFLISLLYHGTAAKAIAGKKESAGVSGRIINRDVKMIVKSFLLVLTFSPRKIKMMAKSSHRIVGTFSVFVQTAILEKRWKKELTNLDLGDILREASNRESRHKKLLKKVKKGVDKRVWEWYNSKADLERGRRRSLKIEQRRN